MSDPENLLKRFSVSPRYSVKSTPRASVLVRSSVVSRLSATTRSSGARMSVAAPSASASEFTRRGTESRVLDVGDTIRKSLAVIEEIEDADQFFIQHDDEYDEIGHTLKGLDVHHDDINQVEDAEDAKIEQVDTQTAGEKKTKGDEDLQADFFEKVVDTDADKKKVVEKIEGMEADEDFFAGAGEEEEPPPDTRSVKSTRSTKSTKSVKAGGGSLAGDVKRRRDTSNSQLSKAARRTTGDTERESKSSVKKIPSGSVATVTASVAVSFMQDDPEKQDRKKTKEQKKKEKMQSKTEDMPVYETAPRYEGISDEELLGFDISQDTEPVKLFDYVEESAEEEELRSTEEEIAVLEREPYYARHRELTEEIMKKQSCNFIYQKKLAMFFKRRKMDYVTRETEWSFDAQQKYHRKLEAYGELTNYANCQKVQMTQAIDTSRDIKNKKGSELVLQFKKMQEREGEIGYGLINTKTGNAIPDKHVERLIRRQQFQMDQVCSMRLKYIKLKDMVQEKLDAISALDKIGPNLLLADYEQLKIDNMSHADKIEEKEEELARLRSKCANTIQDLAHIREKSAALEADLDDLKQERNEVETDYIRIRENMNYLKTQRMVYRHMTNKIVEESGLLTQPTLLKDMEKGLEALKIESAQLDSLLADYKKRARHIKTIRKKIEEQTEMKKAMRKTGGLMRKHSLFLNTKSQQKLAKIYKGRPTLLMPTIESAAFESLKSIKPKMTINRKRHTNKA